MTDIYGTSWGATPRTIGDAGGVVTWSLVGAGYNIGSAFSSSGASVDSSTLGFDVQSIISAAFDAWSSHGDIEFMQVEDSGGDPGTSHTADIRIFFGSIPGSTIGFAYYPSGYGSMLAGDMLLDSDIGNNWANNQTTFFGLVLHEIGHALGLGHEDSGVESVMTSFLSETSLQQDDVDGIQTIYGAQDNSLAIFDMRSGQVELNILEGPAAPGLLVNGNDLDNNIDGTDSAEEINGAAGNDTLIGQGGNDTLIGGTGNDTLIGGVGFDAVTGDAGADVFVFLNGDDTMTITDFEAGVDDLALGGLPNGFTVANLRRFVSQDGDDVVIAADGQEVRFEDTLLSDLSASDVIFV